MLLYGERLDQEAVDGGDGRFHFERAPRNPETMTDHLMSGIGDADEAALTHSIPFSASPDRRRRCRRRPRSRAIARRWIAEHPTWRNPSCSQQGSAVSGSETGLSSRTAARRGRRCRHGHPRLPLRQILARSNCSREAQQAVNVGSSQSGVETHRPGTRPGRRSSQVAKRGRSDRLS